ncbi:MAG: hypothetical protein J6D06_03340, partial [Clostridia bacterium]|nr:hypothetical protein [Clostridia bacterium]
YLRYDIYLRMRYIPLRETMVPSTTCGGPPPSELKLARRISFASLKFYRAVRIDAYPTVLSFSGGTHGCVPYGAIVLSNAIYICNAVPKFLIPHS